MLFSHASATCARSHWRGGTICGPRSNLCAPKSESQKSHNVIKKRGGLGGAYLFTRGFRLLGFPWIFSSKSRLFNGLRRLSAGNYSRAPLPQRKMWNPRSLFLRTAGSIRSCTRSTHGTIVASILFFGKRKFGSEIVRRRAWFI
jgi:hypothetical protein